MRMGFRWLTATLGAVLALTLVPGTASASVPLWVSNPANCTGVTTKAEWKSGDRYVQIRRGKCGSTYYVWARANDNRVVQLGIYTNSPWKLVETDKTQNGSGNTHYTRGRKAEIGLTYAADAGKGTAILYSP